MTTSESDSPPSAQPARGVDLDELAALEEQRAFLLSSLDDLESEHAVGDLDDDDYATLRADYTLRAARVLEAIEERHDLLDAPPPPHRGIRRLLVAVAVLAIAVIAAVVVTSTSGSKSQTASDDGNLTPSKATQACIDKMGTTFAAPSSGSGAKANFGTEAIATIRCFSQVIADHPDDAVAYTYRGRTLSLLADQLHGVASGADVASFSSRARSDLARARKLAPKYPDALAFSAIDALGAGNTDAAATYLARLDRLQLPGDSPILGIVNNVLRPAIEAAEHGTTSTSAVPTTTAAPGG